MFVKSVFSVIAAIILFVPFVSGQSKADWQKYTSNEGRFEVLYPSTPSAEIGVANSGVPYNIVAANFKGSYFLVSYVDHVTSAPIDIPASLLKAQTADVRETNATLLSSMSINYMGHQARYYKVRVPASDGGYIIGTVMTMYVGQRQYKMVVTQEGKNPDPADAARFISSFRLTQSAASARR